MISYSSVKNWLDRLQMAWQSGDTEAAVELFSHVEAYYERPFGPPGRTATEVRKYWEDIGRQENIKFCYEIIAIEGSTAVAHWRNRFRDTDEGCDVLLDGVFILEYDDKGRCKEFRQWWFRGEDGG